MDSKSGKIYLVCSSEDNGRYYVDYAFSNKKVAAFMQNLCHKYGKVQEITLDTRIAYPFGLRPYRVFMHSDSDPTAILLHNEYDFDDCTNETWRVVSISSKNDADISICMWAKSVGDSIKKASEKLANLRLSGALRKKINKFTAETKKTGAPNAYPLAINSPLNSVSKECDR